LRRDQRLENAGFGPHFFACRFCVENQQYPLDRNQRLFRLSGYALRLKTFLRLESALD